MVHDEPRLDLTRFEYGIIKRKIRQIIGKAGISYSDFHDLEQDFRLHLWQRLQSFSPERGHRNAFATTVIERYLCNVLRDRHAAKRDPHRIQSLSCIISRPNRRPMELSELICDDIADERLGRENRSTAELAHLSSDVAETIATLPMELQGLVEQLKINSVSQIAEETGVPRTTLYTSIAQLRRHFERAGLHFYLRKSPSTRESAG